MPEGVILRKVSLPNGLSLFIYDQSQPLVGDRWMVKLLFFIPIEVKPEYFAQVPEPERAYKTFLNAMGSEIALEQHKLRNFIDQQDLAKTIEEIQQQVLTATLPYFSSPQFAARFVARRYDEWIQEHALDQATRRLLSEEQSEGQPAKE